MSWKAQLKIWGQGGLVPEGEFVGQTFTEFCRSES